MEATKSTRGQHGRRRAAGKPEGAVRIEPTPLAERMANARVGLASGTDVAFAVLRKVAKEPLGALFERVPDAARDIVDAVEDRNVNLSTPFGAVCKAINDTEEPARFTRAMVNLFAPVDFEMNRRADIARSRKRGEQVSVDDPNLATRWLAICPEDYLEVIATSSKALVTERLRRAVRTRSAGRLCDIAYLLSEEADGNEEPALGAEGAGSGDGGSLDSLFASAPHAVTTLYETDRQRLLDSKNLRCLVAILLMLSIKNIYLLERQHVDRARSNGAAHSTYQNGRTRSRNL